MNKRELKAGQLQAHYATCERLAKYLGMDKPDGKKISTALLKAEKAGAKRALALCNDSSYTANGYDRSEKDKEQITKLVRKALGELPPGFLVNSDPRGHALKIDSDDPAGKTLIESVRLVIDWGGYGILSPEITGEY